MSEAGAHFKLLSFSCITSGDELLRIKCTISVPLSISEAISPIASEQEIIPNGEGDQLGKVIISMTR